MIKMKKYKAVIFDMDGTIINSRDFHASIFENFLKDNWKPVAYEDCYKAVGVTVRTVFETMDIPQEKHDAFFELLDRYYAGDGKEILEKTSLAEGIVPVLEYMKSIGTRTAIVSNSLDVVVDMFLDYHDIRQMFDAVLGADRHSYSKNERCKIIEGLLDVSSDEVLYIGDSESDMVLANDLGYDACFAKTPIGWYKDEKYIESVLKPRYTISSYDELLDTLRGAAD